MSISTASSTVDIESSNDSSAPVFGEAAQLLIACNQKLQELGINDTIKLPKIAVIGDQSTGKSSLIEAISSISVPKAAGLCTKCPIAINLSHNEEVAWRCSVFVEEKYSYDAGEVTKSTPLGPWMLQHSVATTFVNSTDNQEELSSLINLAQRLVLNPLRDRNAPLGTNLPSEDHEKFSPNTIRLDISARGWANLSFVDLPGVITRSGKGQPQYYVDLVENLARQYARDKNNIIMLTLPMNHDQVNSKSYSIIEAERVHSRTMTVFTKVDLAFPEQRDQCLRQYFDEESPEEFGYGQHVVMLSPGERHFFAQEPWTSLLNQHMFGVPNLVNRIRGILFQQTGEALPGNLKSIEKRLLDIEELLKTIPAPPDIQSMPWKLREQLMKFEIDVKALFSHGSASRTSLNTRMEGFSDRIADDKPTVSFKSKDEAEEYAEARQALGAASDSDVIEIEDDKMSEEDKPLPKKSGKLDIRSHRFTLEEIYGLNKRHYGSGVGGEIEPKAIEKMNILSVQHWNKTLDEFSRVIRKLIITYVQKVIDSNFGAQKHLPLYKSVCDLANKFLDVAISDGKQLLDQRCAAECATPFTLDSDNRLRIEKEILEERLDSRKEARLQVAQTVHKAQNADTKKKLKLIDESTLKADEWEIEIHMSAKSAAYYDLASKRFVDNVCQDILTHLVPRIQTQLVKFITTKLGLDNIEANQIAIADLMSEQPEREAKRRRLIQEQTNLREGHKYIVGVLNSVQPILTSEPSDTVMDEEEHVEEDPVPSRTPSSSPTKRKAHGPVVDVDESPSPIKKRATRAAKVSNAKNQPVRLPSRHRSSEVEE